MFSKIYSTGDLARYLKYPEAALLDLVYRTDDAIKYGTATLPKRNGDKRTIRTPSLKLKMLQRRLLPFLEELYRPNTRVHGYVKGRGLRSNATFHIDKRFILNADLSDFFPSINFGRIRGRLMAKPYRLTDQVATTIARLTTCDGKLPMGAPTSPIISNMLCSGLDSELSSIARLHGCFYTRYADDLTFSSNRRTFPRALAERYMEEGRTVTVPGVELTAAVEAEGFSLNVKKTRLLSHYDRQEVCGIVCNIKLNTLPKLRRQVRASLHAWRKFGLEAAKKEWAEKFNFRAAHSFENSIRGKIEFIKHVRGAADPLVKKYADQFNEIRKNASKISYQEVNDWRSDLPYVSCCIHSIMDGEPDFSQGSGFVIEDGLIVTNNHVVTRKDGKRYTKIEFRVPLYFKKLDIPVEIISQMPDCDLALLKPKDDTWRDLFRKRFCEISEVSAKRDDVIWLSGWPNYNEGDEIHLVQGHVGGMSYPRDIEVFRIGPNIVFGNSGGPVFNEAGKVVGVATFGSTISDAHANVHNGCVPASRIAELVKLAKM